MSDVLLKFAHISDTHITPGDRTEHRPHHYSERLLNFFKDMAESGQQLTGHDFDVPASVAGRAIIEQINNLPFELDFVLHTGDIMTDPDSVDEYEAAREILSGSRYPVHYIPGNHDLPAGLQLLQPNQPVNGETCDYVIEQNGVRVVCLDSATHGIDHGGRVSPEQLAWLDAQLAVDTDHPVVVAVHHPPLNFGIQTLDFFGFANGDEVHNLLLKYRDKVHAVISGHIHQAVDTIQDGLFYSCVQSPAGQLAIWPYSTPLPHDAMPNPGFNVVIVTANRTYIRRYAYANPVVEQA